MSEDRSRAEAHSDPEVSEDGGDRVAEGPRSMWTRRLDPDERYGLRLTLFAAAFLVVAIPFGLLLEQVVRNGWLVRVDTSAARHLHGWVRRSPGVVRALKAISLLGEPVLFYVIVTIAALWVWRHHGKRLALFLVVTTALGGLLDTAVKLAVNRSRPSLVDPVATAVGKSFPSGHAMGSTVVYGALLLVFLPLIPRRRKAAAVTAALVVVLAIGFSRLALGVHFISDVLGGYVLGLAWLTASAAAFSIWRVDRGRPAVEPLEGLEPEFAGEALREGS
ncbi:MAG: phosphatase PAP2 family protein [Actinomycetota bacterium]|nr:phosphatase PAP2 family protein [Actinomycetota bacterium]